MSQSFAAHSSDLRARKHVTDKELQDIFSHDFLSDEEFSEDESIHSTSIIPSEVEQ